MTNLELRKQLELLPDEWEVSLYAELPMSQDVYSVIGVYVDGQGEIGINLDGVHDYEKVEFIASYRYEK